MAAITVTRSRQVSGKVALGVLTVALAGCALALVGTVGMVACKVLGVTIL